ncbi:MAG: 2-C-methyl-D-erythritol 2,4-cyclodiphosphate synthase [Gammaproteobacteria bacterium AqS3]|nr:2-C-methyl-D-erythritol 2,4-cyclodiphosphate synthase [Gammaproteobacteria bacterium AqS3]
MRIGQGVDFHRLIPGEGITVGGVEIPCEFGVEAHSDGDVLIHALCDALLGAAALGDLGGHFPDSDERYRDVASTRLLNEVLRALQNAGTWKPVNVDSTVVLERPKLAEHIPAMRAHLAEALGVGLDSVSVKATRTEGLGALGRSEGIGAFCSVLIERG